MSSSSSSASLSSSSLGSSITPSTKEELSSLFYKCQKAYDELEKGEFNSTDSNYQEQVTALLHSFIKINVAIEKLCIFSKNEEIEDVDPLDLKYLLTSYYLGMLFTKVHVKEEAPVLHKIRQRHLQQAKLQLQHFLKRCDQMNALEVGDKMIFHRDFNFEDTQNEQHTKHKKKLSAMDSRSEKIERTSRKLKAEKELEKLKEKLEKILLFKEKKGINNDCEDTLDDLDILERKMSLLLLSICTSEALEQLSTIQQELEMLQFIVHMQPNGSKQQKTNNQNNAPSSGLRMINLKPGAPDMPIAQPIQLSNGSKIYKFMPGQTTTTTASTLQQMMSAGTQQLPNGKILTQEQIKSEVFIDRNPATISIEEAGEMELREAIEREKRQKEAEEKQVKKDEDEETEEENAARMKKEREWDDWKDAHPKGMGNMLK